jgi:hypothetical protein
LKTRLRRPPGHPAEQGTQEHADEESDDNSGFDGH